MSARLRFTPRLALVFFFAVVLLAMPARAGEAQIAVAANFKPTLDALETTFEAKSSHTLVVTSGSTGKLYAQIRNGAPFDLFLAADQDRPSRLNASGAAVDGSRFTYAIGQLALWAPNADVIGPDELARGDFRRLAIANPDLAPYGAAARQVIAALHLAETTSGNLIFGENIGQAFAFVRTGNAELGFVALSQILSMSEASRGAYWTPPQELYDPVRQDAVLLARGRDNSTAIAFIEFLKSDEAAAIIESHGYQTP